MKHNSDEIMDERLPKLQRVTNDDPSKPSRIAKESPAVKLLQKLLHEQNETNVSHRERHFTSYQLITCI